MGLFKKSAYSTLETEMSVEQAKLAVRDGIESTIGGMKAKVGGQHFVWGPLQASDGGVFDDPGAGPAWGAEANFIAKARPDGIFTLETRVHDRGDLRRIEIELVRYIPGGPTGAEKTVRKATQNIMEMDPSARIVD